jgi:hypothetical protein
MLDTTLSAVRRLAFITSVPVVGLLLLISPPVLYSENVSPEAAASCASKYNLLRSGTTTGAINFTEPEINSWLALDLSHSYPNGVRDVSVQLRRNNAVVLANVDFDLLKVSVPNLLPDMMQYLFTGVHDVRVEGTINGRNGSAEYDIESVTLDDVPLPSFAVEMLLTRVLRRRFPGKNVESPFNLPFGIDRLSILPGRIEAIRSAR